MTYTLTVVECTYIYVHVFMSDYYYQWYQCPARASNAIDCQVKPAHSFTASGQLIGATESIVQFSFSFLSGRGDEERFSEEFWTPEQPKTRLDLRPLLAGQRPLASPTFRVHSLHSAKYTYASVLMTPRSCCRDFVASSYVLCQSRWFSPCRLHFRNILVFEPRRPGLSH